MLSNRSCRILCLIPHRPRGSQGQLSYHQPGPSWKFECLQPSHGQMSHVNLSIDCVCWWFNLKIGLRVGRVIVVMINYNLKLASCNERAGVSRGDLSGKKPKQNHLLNFDDIPIFASFLCVKFIDFALFFMIKMSMKAYGIRQTHDCIL